MSNDDFRPDTSDEQALDFLRRMLPEAWRVEDLPGDPYLDASVALAAEGRPTGHRFAVMARGQGSPHRREGVITLPGVRVELIEHCAAYPDPVLLLLYDIPRDEGYWLWLKPWIEGARTPRWETIRVTAVSIPESSIFDAEAVRQIAADLGAGEAALAGWKPYSDETVPSIPEWLRVPLPDDELEDLLPDRPALQTAELELKPFKVESWAAPPVEEFPAASEEAAAEVEEVPAGDAAVFAAAQEVPAPEPEAVEEIAAEVFPGEGFAPPVEAQAPAPVQKAPPTPPPAPAQRAPLVLQFQASLRGVAARNYLTYGAMGVRRYGPRAADAPEPDASTLTASLDWLRGGEDAVFSIPGIVFQRDTMDENRVMWVGYSAAHHLQVAWTWDFFRLLSHLYLNIRLTSQPTPTQRALLDALRGLSQGDSLRVYAALPTGNLDQRHPVTAELLAARDSILNQE